MNETWALPYLVAVIYHVIKRVIKPCDPSRDHHVICNWGHNYCQRV